MVARSWRGRSRGLGGALARTVSDDDFYVDADDLCAGDRAALREFLTPRRALDGRLVWPIHELRADHGD